ncbi:MAG: hypothetical protein ACKVOR_07675 [Flavobacteriales bacterium]
MKKTLLTTCVFLVVASTALAQLSKRENYDLNLKMNTRPQAGDAALQFVVPIVDLSGDTSAGLYKGNSLFASDFLTYKYYHTDNTVIRGALRWAIGNATVSGVGADSGAFNNIPEDLILTDRKQKFISREFAVAGGLERHFTNTNIFDVYCAGEAMIGLGRNKSLSQDDFANGDKMYMTRTTPTRIVGFGLITGFNVFVAELPISIGLEYGLTGKWIFGGKTKVEMEQSIDAFDFDESGEWYEQEKDAFGNDDLNINGDAQQYSDLSRRTFMLNTNHNVRLNIHIYFSTLTD